ncbi:MAG: hypothetical protein KGL39_05740 [Patescibacteria group bacterium]|nr:hypothetical protein [Patescibacteria group bacterium]
MERVRQDLKWGDATTRGLPLTVWLAVLTEETGEVARAILKHDRANLRQELVQTGAVVTAMLECLDGANWGVRDEDAG